MRAVLPLAVTLVCGAPIGALADTMDNSFGNAFEIRAPDGSQSTWRYSVDGTYTMSAGGRVVSGVWRRANRQVCVTPTGGTESCFSLPEDEKHVGDSWTAVGPGGEAVTLSLVAEP